MRKMYIHFEQVPVEAAEKILKKQNSRAKRNGSGNGKQVARKSGDAPTGPHTLSTKVEVLTP